MNADQLLIRFIAMDSELERIAMMQKWLRPLEATFDVRRIVGIFGDKDLREGRFYAKADRLRKFGYEMTASEIGCFLSHRQCWEECVAEDKATLVLESDVAPLEQAEFVDLLESLMAAKGSFDVVRLHGVFIKNEMCSRRLAALTKNYDLAQTLGDPMGSAGYLITPDAAARLLNASERFCVPLDVFLGSTWLHKRRVRTVKPYPLFAYEFPSVIGDRKRPAQSIFKRLSIESARAFNDIRRVAYLPWHFWS